MRADGRPGRVAKRAVKMLLVFFRHGSIAALVAGVAAELLLWLFGIIALSPLLILLGALLFYLSEYGMHRFAFHAPPLAWAPLRKLQHRLHYDHHVEPNRLDLSGAEPCRRRLAGRAAVRNPGRGLGVARGDAGDPAL